MTILPTILYLMTKILKETAIKASDNQVPLPVSTCLQAIKTVITSPSAKTEKTQKKWTDLIRSTLASILEYPQTGKRKKVPSEINMELDTISEHFVFLEDL